jgi:hypothetical protein
MPLPDKVVDTPPTPQQRELSPIRMDDPKLKAFLESCLRDGVTCVLLLPASLSTVLLDPLVYSLLTKTVVNKGYSKFILLGEHMVEYDERFRCVCSVIILRSL